MAKKQFIRDGYKDHEHISTAEAADMTGLSRPTINKFIRLGYVASGAVHGAFRVDRVSLEKFVFHGIPEYMREK